MKKVNMFMTVSFILTLLCVLPGCKNDDDTTNPQSITFVDDAKTKEFTIDENFGFMVKFINPDATANFMGIEKDDVIKGKITETFKPDANGDPTSVRAKWNEDLVGSAAQMASPTNQELNNMLKVLFSEDSIGILLTYTEDGAVVDLQFKGSLAGAATPLMGGKYTKK